MIRPSPRKPSLVVQGSGDVSNGFRPPKSLPLHSSTPFLTNHHSNASVDHSIGLPFVPFSSDGTESGSARFANANQVPHHDGRPWLASLDSSVLIPREISTRVSSPSTLYHSIGSPVDWKYSSPTNQFRGFVPIHAGDESREATPVFGSSFKTPTRKASPSFTLETASLSVSPHTLGSYDRSCTTPSSLAAAVAASQASIKSVRSSYLDDSPYCRPVSAVPQPKRSSLQAAVSESNRVARPNSAPTVVGGGRLSETDCPRKVRLKTELCMHYETGRNCPFGNSKSLSYKNRCRRTKTCLLSL
jgi:hypothetical protein